MTSAICIAEDRQSCELGVELLVRSVLATSPWATIYVFCPTATEEFSRWLSQFSQVVHQTERLDGTYGWNVKPQALLHLLDLGMDEVIWLDSDILVLRDIREILGPGDDTRLFVAEEALWGAHDDHNALRTRAWGFEVGRVFPFCLNSAVLRVTERHRSLLVRWKKMLEGDDYREAQVNAWSDRPSHLLGDQDVLTALLASKGFADLEIRILRRGRDIIQYFGLRGYTTAERLRNIFSRAPAFIHSQGVKIWTEDWYFRYVGTRARADFRSYLEAIYTDISPYALHAATLKQDRLEWSKSHFRLSGFLRLIGFGYFPLVGLPVAAVTDICSVAFRAIIKLQSLRGRSKIP